MLKKLSLTLSTLVVTTVAGAQADGSPAGDVPATPELEWALAFVMSYDNDLEHCGPIILDGLEAGVKSDKVRVLVSIFGRATPVELAYAQVAKQS